MIDYDFVYQLYNKLGSYDFIFYTILGTKIVSIVLLVVYWYNKFFAFSDEAVQGDDKKITPITPNDIFLGIAIVALVGGYNYILDLLDFALTDIEQGYITVYNSSIFTPYEFVNEDVTSEGFSLELLTLEIKEYLAALIDPFNWVLNILQTVFWLIDSFIYGAYLIERFFLLGILKMFGSLLLAFAVIPKLQKLFWGWLFTYIGIFMLIGPYLLITFLTSIVFQEIQLVIADQEYFVSDNLVAIPGYIFSVFLKYKLFKTTYGLVTGLFRYA